MIRRDTETGPVDLDLSTAPDDDVAAWALLGHPDAAMELLRRQRATERALPPGAYDARYNKAHDKLGKFASKAGGGAATVNTGDWTWERSEENVRGRPGTVWKFGEHRVADAGSGMSREEIETVVLPTVHRLQSSNPIKGAIDIRIQDELLDYSNPVNPKSVNGLTVLGTGQIMMNGGKIKDRKYQADFSGKPFLAPAGHRRPLSENVLVHEWGHAIDHSAVDKSYAQKSQELFRAGKQPSKYGATNHYESHAEAFIEYQLSGGKTAYGSVQDYAKEMGWRV